MLQRQKKVCPCCWNFLSQKIYLRFPYLPLPERVWINWLNMLAEWWQGYGKEKTKISPKNEVARFGLVYSICNKLLQKIHPPTSLAHLNPRLFILVLGLYPIRINVCANLWLRPHEPPLTTFLFSS